MLIKPMAYFANKGDLPMMRWLYVNGADTRDVDVAFHFPMYWAAVAGQLEACKWLFDHGAAKDVKRRTPERPRFAKGLSPLSITFTRPSHRDINRWLILNGALCKDDNSGDLDVGIMQQDLDPRYERNRLLEWANELHRARISFLLFLSGALSSAPQHAYRTRRNTSPVKVLSGKSGILELIFDYTGVIRGREAYVVKQLTEMVPKLFPGLYVADSSGESSSDEFSSDEFSSDE